MLSGATSEEKGGGVSEGREVEEIDNKGSCVITCGGGGG